MFLSESQEIAMGKESDPGIIKFFGVYEDQILQKFIEDKGPADGCHLFPPSLKVRLHAFIIM